jgi:hypothetical protein
MSPHQTIIAGDLEHSITSVFWLKVSKHYKPGKDQASTVDNIEKAPAFAVGFSFGDTVIYKQSQPKVRMSPIHKFFFFLFLLFF